MSDHRDENAAPSSNVGSSGGGASIPPERQLGTVEHQHKHENHHGHDHDHDHENLGPACACGHDHTPGEGHSHSGVGLKVQLVLVLPVTIAILILAVILQNIPAEESMARALGLLAALIAGGPIIWSAIKGLSRGQTNVNELVAMSIIGAIALGWLVEAGFVALILQIGALIEQIATESAQKAVLALQKLAPVHARVKHGDHDHVIEAEKLKIGDTIIVQPGERVAGDGIVTSGTTSVDESMVTGESIPADKTVASQILAGTINLTGSVEVQVTRVGESSALGQTIALVRRAQQFQPQIIRAADRFFAFYTPIILVLSVVAWWVTSDPTRMVTMWVVGCPCAMLLASPLAIVVSLARASRSGIQIKAGPFVEASAGLDTVVFDKTGTLTTGKFVVNGVHPSPGVSQAELLRIATTIENRSSHPLAKAIVGFARAQGISPAEAAEVRILEGLGVEARVDDRVARAGSLKIVPGALLADAALLDRDTGDLPVVPVYVVLGERLLGAIYLTDEIRPEAAKAIQRLRTLGVKRVVMLTGDRRRTAEMVGRAVGCDEVFAELLPAQKVDIFRKLQRGDRGVAMVGDGINDAPSLAASTVGIAMGLRGTDAAIEASDAVLLKDDLTRIPLLIYLARRTRAAIFENLGFAVVFAGAAELMAAYGLFSPVVAALVHIGAVVVIAVNSVRLAGSASLRRRAPVLPSLKSASPARVEATPAIAGVAV